MGFYCKIITTEIDSHFISNSTRDRQLSHFTRTQGSTFGKEEVQDRACTSIYLTETLSVVLWLRLWPQRMSAHSQPVAHHTGCFTSPAQFATNREQRGYRRLLKLLPTVPEAGPVSARDRGRAPSLLSTLPTHQQAPGPARGAAWDPFPAEMSSHFVKPAEKCKETHDLQEAERDAMHVSLCHCFNSCSNPTTPVLIQYLAK